MCTCTCLASKHMHTHDPQCIHVYVTCRSHVGHMQVTCMTHAGHMYVTCTHTHDIHSPFPSRTIRELLTPPFSVSTCPWHAQPHPHSSRFIHVHTFIMCVGCASWFVSCTHRHHSPEAGGVHEWGKDPEHGHLLQGIHVPSVTTVEAVCCLCSNVHNIIIDVQVTCRSHVCHMQVTCMSHAGHMSVVLVVEGTQCGFHFTFSPQGSPGCFYLLPQKAVTPVKLAKNGDMRIFWKVLGSFMSRLSPLGSSLHLLESNCAGNKQGEEVLTYSSACSIE